MNGSLLRRFSQSDFAARLQNVVSQRRKAQGLYKEITQKLPLPESGRLLDIGTGSGFQLQAIHEARPGLALYGLDLSGPAVKIAKANLVGLDIKLKRGSIEQAPYPDRFFDLATCHACLSYWRLPVDCLNEVFRILKPGGVAVLFEPYKDVDVDAALAAIQARMEDEILVRRFLAVNLNKFILRRGDRIGLHLYTIEEIGRVIARSGFESGFEIRETVLLDVPIYMQLTLKKPAT